MVASIAGLEQAVNVSKQALKAGAKQEPAQKDGASSAAKNSFCRSVNNFNVSGSKGIALATSLGRFQCKALLVRMAHPDSKADNESRAAAIAQLVKMKAPEAVKLVMQNATLPAEVEKDGFTVKKYVVEYLADLCTPDNYEEIATYLLHANGASRGDFSQRLDCSHSYVGT